VPPESSHECAPGLSTFLSEFHSVRPDILGVSLYHHYDQEAVRHLFRVAAGLDSMLLGEAEILGQVREAYRFAHEQGATGAGAESTSSRVPWKSERRRALGNGAWARGRCPWLSAGVKLAERIFGKLNERKALVLGQARSASKVVSQLRDRGIAQLQVMNRSRDRADELPSSSAERVVGWGEWDAALQSPDVCGVVGQRG